jgi:hypothetical protein
VDTALQVTDRPQGKARRLRQFLLRQLRLAPKPPQQPGKRKGTLLLLGQGPRPSQADRLRLATTAEVAHAAPTIRRTWLPVIMWAFVWAVAYGAQSGRPRAWDQKSAKGTLMRSTLSTLEAGAGHLPKGAGIPTVAGVAAATCRRAAEREGR